MAAQAIYKGTIVFENVRVPVELYSAVEDRSVHFRLLHAADYVHEGCLSHPERYGHFAIGRDGRRFRPHVETLSRQGRERALS